MKKLVLRLIVFLLPFELFACFIIAADPYNYFNVSRLVPGEMKYWSARLDNELLWKFISFKRSDTANILLGDSRMDDIDARMVNRVSDEKYFNLACGGATLQEIVESLRFTARRNKLKKVYISLNLNHFTDNTSQRMETTRNTLIDPLEYFRSMNVIRLSGRLARTTLRGDTVPRPDIKFDSRFWRHQIDASARGFYENYKYPKVFNKELASAVNECRKNNVEIIFVILPTHIELQKQIDRYGLRKESERFRREISSLATTYDFDYENSLTSKREMFRDPFHANLATRKLVIDEIWGNKAKYARIYGPAGQTP